jgi:predicted nuclease of predicted toxin-antitoxin system
LLRLYGWDAVHVAEAGLSRAADEEIVEFARLSNSVCVTLDHDFRMHWPGLGASR